MEAVPPSHRPSMSSRLAHRIGPLLGLLLFAGALWVLHYELKAYRFHDVMLSLEDLPRKRFFAALVLTCSSYLVMTGYDALALRYVQHPLPYGKFGLASFISYAFSNNMGFGMIAGGSVRYRLYSAWGLSALEITKVVGLNSLAYFWTKRTPDGSARDLERILDHYLSRWKKEKAILLGYSLGADVLPFMASRLPKELMSRVSLIALLGPARQVDFEFHLTDWLGGPSEGKTYPILPEVQKLVGTRLLCLYGEEEKDSLCRDLEPSFAKVVALGGAHHFAGNYDAIAEAILRQAN
jgi:hypothetical protein